MRKELFWFWHRKDPVLTADQQRALRDKFDLPPWPENSTAVCITYRLRTTDAQTFTEPTNYPTRQSRD